MTLPHSIDEKAKDVFLPADSDVEFFLIHGYTGSPTDFNGLARYLHNRFSANVKVLRLPGHGTQISDLDDLEFEHFYKHVREELKKDIASGKHIVLGGVSFGAQIALVLASEFPVKAVFHACIPYSMRFPFSLGFLKYLQVWKKYWRKQYDPKELTLRKGAFFYEHMHINGLSIARQANAAIQNNIHKVHCPCLMIHSVKDSIGHFRSLRKLEKVIPSKIRESIVFDYDIKNHNIFFSPVHEKLYAIIGDFMDKHGIAGHAPARAKVAAVVPAFNEGGRIGHVLEVLKKTPIVDEVIVVDDASTDNTPEVAQKYQVIYVRNEKNMGKSFSMERGVSRTDADIIFFSDADLSGLTPDIITSIIKPVLERKYDMFVGIRSNISQKTFHPFAILSGERALRRKLWDALPAFYKHRYRIEIGLNYHAKNIGTGFGFQVFPYYQMIKEKKYGLWKGTYYRWRMNIDVVTAFLRAKFIDPLFRSRWNIKMIEKKDSV